MDPPLVNEASFTAAANPSSYSLAGLLSFPTSSGGRMTKLGRSGGDASVEESTVTEQSGSGNGGAKRRRNVDDSSSKLVSTSSTAVQDLSELNTKRAKVYESTDQNCGLKTEAEANSGSSVKPVVEKSKTEPPNNYIHVRARRGQATDSHSLAERARREKISERMKILQDLVPGCNKVIGKALVLDEIINYVQSLQRQVEFLSMKLEAVNSRLNPAIAGFPSKDVRPTASIDHEKPRLLQNLLYSFRLENMVMQLAAPPIFDASGMVYGPQTPVEYTRGSQGEWLHMQVGSGFERAT